MNNSYKIIVCYDGTAYAGWQEQPGKNSICGELKKSFKKAFHLDCYVVAASRTDAGVHALGQIVLVKTELNIAPEKLVWVWNNALAADVYIRQAQIAPEGFHPWYAVKQKTYYYHIFPTRPLPFFAKYGWFYPYDFDEKKFAQALQLFQGTHDFNAFRSADDFRENTQRTILSIDSIFIKRYTVYQVQVIGKKFMRHMIRRMVGAALTVATQSNNFELETIERLLKSGDPNHPLQNAPSCGLVLKKIDYE